MKNQKDQGETHVIHSLPRNSEEKVQFAIRKYRGKYYADRRIWFQSEETGTLLPTKRGVPIFLDQLPELRRGVERLIKAAERLKAPEEVEV